MVSVPNLQFAWVSIEVIRLEVLVIMKTALRHSRVQGQPHSKLCFSSRLVIYITYSYSEAFLLEWAKRSSDFKSQAKDFSPRSLGP